MIDSIIHVNCLSCASATVNLPSELKWDFVSSVFHSSNRTSTPSLQIVLIDAIPYFQKKHDWQTKGLRIATLRTSKCV